MDPQTACLADLIGAADRILVFTGAGISTDAGIPDYRGPSGVWKTQQPVQFSSFLESEDQRTRYWEQKVHSWKTVGSARPTAVHDAITELDGAGKLEAVVTQNVDGLHILAETTRTRVLEVHGTAREAGCLECGARSPIEPHLATFEDSGVPPICADCGGLLKPATISFGQSLDPLTLARSIQAADRCNLVVALGTTLSVHPAASIPLRAAERGIPYVIVNQGPTDHDRHPTVTIRIEGAVGPIFAAAVARALADPR